MIDLKTLFLLSQNSTPPFDLELAVEAILDGNDHVVHEHLLRLLHEELSQLSNERIPQLLLRFSKISSDRAFAALKDDIRKGQLTLSNPFKFNDPMDPILKVWIEQHAQNSKAKIDRKLFSAAQRALRNLRICCLTSLKADSHQSPLMWSHYADSHKGIAIQYKVTEEVLHRYSDDNHLLRLGKVRYRDYEPMSDYITLDNAVLAKGSAWDYEKEFRLFYFSMIDNDFMQLDSTLGCMKRNDFISLEGFEIKSVYLGTNINVDKETEIRAIATAKNIPVKKMNYSNDDITRLIIEDI